MVVVIARPLSMRAIFTTKHLAGVNFTGHVPGQRWSLRYFEGRHSPEYSFLSPAVYHQQTLRRAPPVLVLC